MKTYIADFRLSKRWVSACRTWFALFLIAVLTHASRSSDDTTQTAKPIPIGHDLRFTDVHGKSYWLKAAKGQRALVLVFVTTDCPIANSYQPALSKMHQEFQKKGFEFAIVHEGPAQSIDKLKEHAKEFAIPLAVVMDSDHSIAKATGATKTPEVFVFGEEGEIQYQGRIDNLHQSFGKKRATATREDLRIALTEIELGQPVSVPKTEAVGCSIQLK